MSTPKNLCSGLVAVLKPNDMSGSSYSLTVGGLIHAGPEKVIYELMEGDSPDFNPTILTLWLTPEPTAGDQGHKVKDFKKDYDSRPFVQEVIVVFGEDKSCNVPVNEVFN